MTDIARLTQVIEPEAKALGFDLVRVKMFASGPEGDGERTLQVMAEDPATGQLVVEQCMELSRRISDAIDAVEDGGEELVEGAYQLEVSSPGIDRPLTREKDFADWAGHDVNVSLDEPAGGHKKLRGELLGVADGEVQIEDRKHGRFAVPFEQIHTAKLVLTDKLIAATRPLDMSGAEEIEEFTEEEKALRLMASPISANKAELLAIANSVASEKMIDKAIVIEAMEEAIQKSARSRYGAENDIRAKLDPLTGDLRLWRVVEVVEEVEDYFKQVDLKQAEKLQPGAKVGDFIVDPLPPVDLGRIDAQSAKQVIFQKVRDAERERQFEEFKDRAGEVITGVIKSVEFGHVIVNLGRAEGVIRRDQQIPREAARVGERVRALIMKVERNNRGPQIFLSRAHPEFMKKLFAQEVPEIYDGIITIQAAARDPGSRAKIGVISRDSSIDPVGACVGMKGSRVQAVVQELQGEKIDIIPWSEDTATFVVNALQPATVSRVVLDEEEGRIEVVVPDDQLSLAIGRRGQNVRLASQLTESQIDIMTEEEASEKRQREFAERSKMFEEELDVDETLSQLLVAEGFAELEEVAYVERDELAAIEGFDDELAEELQERAKEALAKREEAFRAERTALGVDDALAEIPHLNEQMLVTLGKAGIKTLDDLADLATDELIAKKREAPRRRQNAEAGPPMRRDRPRPEDKGGVLGEYGLSEEQGNEIIMAARAHWFEDEEAPAPAPAVEEAADADSSQ